VTVATTHDRLVEICRDYITDDVLARAQQALDGVTPGPWRVGSDTYHDIYGPDGRLVFEHDPGPRREDAEFIAAARSLIPELIDALQAARTENGEDNNERPDQERQPASSPPSNADATRSSNPPGE